MPPLPDVEVTWSTNGSSFVQNGQRYTGVAVIPSEEVVWTEPMPTGTSPQRVDLVALTKALEWDWDTKLTSTLAPAVHLPPPMCTGQYIKRGDCCLQRERL